MASQTSNLNLVKPALSDFADITDLNSNADIIDSLLPRLVMFNSGNAITAAGTYTVTVGGINDYWRPAQIILSDETAVLSNWSWSVNSSGVCSLTIPTNGIKSSGTTVSFLLTQSNSNS